MRRPVHLTTADESVQAAARRMKEANIGFLPVCDDHAVLVGVVTDRDLALRVCAEGGAASEIAVHEVASRGSLSCRPTDDLSRAEELMVQGKKSRIVVTDREGHVEGIISLSDVAMADSARAAQVLREVASREVLGGSGRLRSQQR